MFGQQRSGYCQANSPAGGERRFLLFISPRFSSSSSSHPANPESWFSIPSTCCVSFVWFCCLPPLSRVYWILKRDFLAAALYDHPGASIQAPEISFDFVNNRYIELQYCNPCFSAVSPERPIKVFRNGTLRILELTELDGGNYQCIFQRPNGEDMELFQVRPENIIA